MIERIRHSMVRIARHPRLQVGRNGVDVGGGGVERQVGTGAAGQFDHAFQQLVRAARAFVVDDRLQRFDPLPRFLRVGIILQHFVEPVHRALHQP
ncbi:hypothetical protein [Thermomonas sp.]|uniref:hypothetical protein n=1 Tax=Thermomonas sp. TaxID=1971895 RepID=UPI0025D2F78C|nr:hypothetical protein [Thermomonas sp.]